MHSGWIRRLGLWACIVALVIVVGCREREHRKMRVHEEQRPGEVREQPPGEMIVE